MFVTFDEPKRLANLKIHGLDFAEFEDGFDFASAKRFETYASRTTGRARFGLIGWFRDELVVVAVMSPLGSEALSLVSLRPANIKERVDNGFC